ncbi:MAG: hypothetical protein SF097_23095 [Acidobacteriota bacterium]|nr:hypothetical protein [Acidobacteriota bacterium]
MLKISEISLSEEAAKLRLEGEMIGQNVLEARQALKSFLAAGIRLTLDVTDLLFADRDGIAFLQELAGLRVEFINCSPFLSEQLKEAVRKTGGTR